MRCHDVDLSIQLIPQYVTFLLDSYPHLSYKTVSHIEKAICERNFKKLLDNLPVCL